MPSCPPCHFIIATPNGVTSRGVCKRCGVERQFPNAGRDLPMPVGRRRTRREEAAAKELEGAS